MWRIDIMVKNDMKELHVWNYKIGLNNWVCERNYTKGFFVWNYILCKIFPYKNAKEEP